MADLRFPSSVYDGQQNVGVAGSDLPWQPALDLSWVTGGISNVFSKPKYSTSQSLSTSSGVATAQVDGSTGHTNWIQGLTGAILSGMGGSFSDEQIATPVAYQPQQKTTIAGLPVSTVVILGFGAAAIYYVASK